jgi:hypothetical protein
MHMLRWGDVGGVSLLCFNRNCLYNYHEDIRGVHDGEDTVNCHDAALRQTFVIIRQHARCGLSLASSPLLVLSAKEWDHIILLEQRGIRNCFDSCHIHVPFIFTGNREYGTLRTTWEKSINSQFGCTFKSLAEVSTYSYVAFPLNKLPFFPFIVTVSEASLINIAARTFAQFS